MKKNFFKILSPTSYLLLAILFLPSISFALFGGLKELLAGISKILNSLVPLLIGLAVLYFLWGLGQFILKDAGNDKTRAEGKQKMLWGVIALFVMISLYGIIKFIGDAVGIPTNIGGSDCITTPDAPDYCQ